MDGWIEHRGAGLHLEEHVKKHLEIVNFLFQHGLSVYILYVCIFMLVSKKQKSFSFCSSEGAQGSRKCDAKSQA